MPEPLTSYITAWQGKYSLISGDLWQLGNALKGAATYIEAENWAYAALYLDSAGDSAHEVAHHIKFEGDDVYTYMYNTLHWIDDNIGDGGGVTMDAILSAMITSDFDNLQKFIGIVDAYRVALWNAPFNTDFYAALARGFQTWP